MDSKRLICSKMAAGRLMKFWWPTYTFEETLSLAWLMAGKRKKYHVDILAKAVSNELKRELKQDKLCGTRRKGQPEPERKRETLFPHHTGHHSIHNSHPTLNQHVKGIPPAKYGMTVYDLVDKVKLSKTQRKIAYKRFAEYKTLKEIGEEMGFTFQNIQEHTKNILEKLRWYCKINHITMADFGKGVYYG